MDTKSLQGWIALFESAAVLGPHILAAVKKIANRELSAEENRGVLAKWEDNAERTRINAGLPPEA